jgi:predicted HTH domain antitoxin
MRFAAAIYWYERGELSQAAAARVAGLERLAFLDLLADRKADVFLVDLHDLQQEVARG